ncbi:Pex12 amino terminal region-domain-containing protein [Naematelia encephala]|uniref:Pex12 amino terminal region-domain-containing protein n=1 Tax=Naematelia encephala TaxID=71784 RepID=A0A1Y2BHK5_9TREE|nr:Pex12 amino terminal region-domain-containing protein [Naematelia encephala]
MAVHDFGINAEASSSRNRLPSAPRVSQVDADELDEGLVSMLGERVEKALGNFQSSLGHDIKPEIALVLKLVVFRFSILDPSTRASPGAKLQNLKLAATRSSRRIWLLYLLLHPPIFPSYLLTRLRQHALSSQWPDLPAHDWRRKAWKAVIRAETAAKAWELAGWGWFLWDGRYPSLLMRLLGLRLVPASPHLARLVSYEFMNRQLVWGAFTEFLMFAIPFLPPIPNFLTPSSLFSPIKNLLKHPTPIDYNALITLPRSSDSSKTPTSTLAHSGPLAKLPRSTCPICYLRHSSDPIPLDASTSQGASINLPPISQHESDEETKDETRIYVPAQTDCWGGCRWCYYCIAGELAKHHDKVKEIKLGSKSEEMEKWSCLRCGGGVSRAWRVGPAASMDNETSRVDKETPSIGNELPSIEKRKAQDA